MTPRELNRLFRLVLKTSVPIVSLSGCGGDADGGHRLVETQNPIISEQMDGSVEAPMCDSELWNKANNDTNMRASPTRLVTMRNLLAGATNPLEPLKANPPLETCVNLCGGNERFVSANVRLTSGDRIQVNAQVHVDDCEVYTEEQPPKVACLEAWQWQMNCWVAGRRPEGFMPTAQDSGDVGAFLAVMAQLEAASVPAFERLQRELLAHGAPAALIEQAAQFAGDEVKHTRMTTALARRYGGQPVFEALPMLDVRELDEVLLDNAIEGCVRETFGALVAHWQADHAEDSVVRGAMQVIAEDETRHAAMAWEIERWARPRLSASAQRRLDEARAEAVRELLAASSEPSAAGRRVLGLPGAEESRTLATGLRDQLWA